jgi:hypothetical protein
LPTTLTAIPAKTAACSPPMLSLTQARRQVCPMLSSAASDQEKLMARDISPVGHIPYLVAKQIGEVGYAFYGSY